jgi:UDP-N-acetylglucosamine transferase subunit ALG13
MSIFVTVGTQLPFDRMVRAMDAWSGAHPQHAVFAQIGPSAFRPRHMQWAEMIDADLFRAKVESARLVVSHAGMGSIITALEMGKPLVVMPRRAAMGEHRNDHQMATARQLQKYRTVRIAWDENELGEALGALREMERAASEVAIAPCADPRLIGAIQQFILGGAPVLSQSGGEAMALRELEMPEANMG